MLSFCSPLAPWLITSYPPPSDVVRCTASFKNAIIILTSNLGSSAILENMGTDMNQQGVKDMVMGYVSEIGWGTTNPGMIR